MLKSKKILLICIFSCLYLFNINVFAAENEASIILREKLENRENNIVINYEITTENKNNYS